MERRDLATDVLVIGNGGAGLRAAVEAAEQGCAVILASKLSRDKPNSTAVIAGWGTHRPPDEADDYFRMVVEEGNYLNDQELAWIYAHEVVERMPELRRFGVEMRLDDSSLERPGTISELWFFPGPKGRLGDAIRDPLRRTADEQGVETLDNTLVTGLLSSDESVVGATALDLVSGELLVISAKVVVLATGGASGIYARQNNPPGTTGDGYALAYRAGADLVDMEFDTFMMSVEDLRDLFSGDPDEARILSIGSAHYSCGGVKVGTDRCSTVEGLYAAGEVAGGTFGSGRLGGSSVGDIIVSGYWAGRNAAEAAHGRDAVSVPEDQASSEEERLDRLLTTDGLPPSALRAELRRAMWQKAGPIRREASLQSVLDDLAALRAKSAEMGAKSPAELQVAVEVGFMLDVAEVIASAARERRESRGAHWRLDYPEPDNDQWLRNIIVSRGSGGRPALRTVPAAMARITSPGPCRIGTPWSGGYVVPDL